MANEMLFYLNLELRGLKGFFTSKYGQTERLLYLNLNSGDQEAFLPRSKWKVTKGFSTLKPGMIERLLYLNLDGGDQEASLP